MALTNKQVDYWADWLTDRAIHAGYDKAVYTLSDGREIKVEILTDDYTNEGIIGDYFGEIEWGTQNPYTGYSQRPDGFNGAARKIETRDGYIWWQPPADLLNSPENLENMRKHVQGYYHEQWWYVGVCVTVSKPCSCGIHTAGKNVSLWGVESDSSAEDFKEIISGLIWEAWNDQGDNNH